MKFKSLVVIMACLYSNVIFSASYRCAIDYSEPGESYNAEQLAQFVRNFDYELDEKRPGKQIQFKDVQVFVWTRKEQLYLKVKFEDGKEVTTFYGKDQDRVLMKWASNREITCSLGGTAMSDEADAVLSTALRADSNLKTVAGELAIEVLQPFTFVFEQRVVNGRMRPAVFVGGKTFSGDKKIKKGTPRCQFFAQLEFDQDTEMEMGSKWIIKSKNHFSNDGVNEVITFDFVGASGSVAQKNSMLTPMNIQCTYPKGVAFKVADFKQIVGSFLDIKRP